jgi:beta-galactosidase
MTGKICIIILMLSFFIPLTSSAQGYTFEIKGEDFVYDGKPERIISGEIHYTRIPHQYWRHRMQMLKAMGLNTIATYVF